MKKLNFERTGQRENIKNGKLYDIFGTVINCTNEQDGQILCLYSDGNNVYVRDINEMDKKFKKEVNNMSLFLNENEVCPHRASCQYNSGCTGAVSGRENKFVCDYVENGQIKEGMPIRNPMDKTGRMKVIMEQGV